MKPIFPFVFILFSALFCQCGSHPGYPDPSGHGGGGGVLMGGPSVAARKAGIASEPTGDFYYGRRYYVKKTRYWGYLRNPRKPWKTAKLVMMNERFTRQPDRLPEETGNPAYSYDQNYEYKIYGRYSGEMAYDPNSNKILPEFLPTRFELVSKNPGWIFSPGDRYNPHLLTLRP